MKVTSIRKDAAQSPTLQDIIENLEILTGRRGKDASIDYGTVGGIATDPIYIYQLTRAINGLSSGVYFANAYSSFAEAVNTIGSAVATLVVSNEQAINEALDVNALAPNTTVVVLGSGKFVGAAATTLNLGKFEAPLRQVFYELTVTFGAGTVEAVHPEWWGIDGTADEVQINQAIAAAVNVLRVELQPVEYNIAAGISYSYNYGYLGSPLGMARLLTSADIDAVTVTACSYVTLENMRIKQSNVSPTKAGFKIYDAVYYSRFINLAPRGFKYGFEIYSSTLAKGVAYNSFEHLTPWSSTTHELYMHQDSTGWVNENEFGGKTSFHPASTGNCLRACGNENKFNCCSFENGDEWQFGVEDYGSNVFIAPRFEADGYGYYSENTAGGFLNCARLLSPYFSGGKYPRYVSNGGYLQVSAASFMGGIDAADRVSTTVDADSASGQKVLNVTATTNIEVGDAVCVDEDGDREEWGYISSISAGVSVTLHANLRYTHTGAQADTVVCKGKKYGMEFYQSWDEADIFVNGKKVVALDNAGDIDLTTVSVSGTKVVGAQQTGVSAMTNLTTPANLDADTVTVAELADIVGNLIAKLRAHGLVAN